VLRIDQNSGYVGL